MHGFGWPPPQVAEVVEQDAKWAWLQARLASFIDEGDVLIFAATKARVDELTAQLQAAGIKCAPFFPFFCASFLPPSVHLLLLCANWCVTLAASPCATHCMQPHPNW